MAKRVSVSDIDGLLFFEPIVSTDQRGLFRKVVHSSEGLMNPFVSQEIFYSQSIRGVIRGMHLQAPPFAAQKIVWLSAGRVSDVILDLRTGSPTYKHFCVVDLSPEKGALFIPRGCAHGFEVTSDSATMHYAQDMPYKRIADVGVHWNSFGHNWQSKSPILSERDNLLPDLDQFHSPFG